MKNLVLFFLLFTSLTYTNAQDCHIYDLVAEKSDCDSLGFYSITLNFQHENTSDSFNIDGYGVFAYADLPVTLHGFEGNGQGQFFHIFDHENHSCGLERDIEGKHCRGACEIGNIVLTKLDCDNDNKFYLIIDFNHVNTSDSFKIQGNGHQYGTFAYADLPVQIGPLDGNFNDTYEFVIKDLENGDCTNFSTLSPPYCNNGNDCHIHDLIAEKSDCDSLGFYSITLNFQHENTSDSFNIGGYGVFAYADLPVTLNGFEGNGLGHVFEIFDQLNHDCGLRKEIEGKHCDNNCHIYDLVAEKSDCDSLGFYSITLNFQHENTSDSFNIDDYGVFAYADLPITLHGFEGNGQGHTFKIIDLENHDCGLRKEIEGKHCDGSCEIGEIHIMKSICNEDHQFYIKIDFDYSGTSDSFTVKGNGHNYGTFAYADLPIVISPLDGNFDGVYEFVVRDLLNPDCKNVKVLEPPYCDDSGDCHIHDFEYHLSACDSLGFYSIKFSFQHENTSDSFRIAGYGTFAYADLPIILYGFEGNGQGHVFEIFDLEHRDCGLRKEIEGKHCDNEDCHLSEPEFRISNCNNDHQFYVLIDFDSQGTSDSFNLKVNGTFYGRFAYDDLPVAAGPYNGLSDDTLRFLIRDQQHERCAADGRVLPPYCPDRDQLITDISWEPLDCHSTESFFANVDVNHDLPSDMLLDIWQGDQLLASSIVANFPLQILVRTDGSPYLRIQQHDNEHNFQVYTMTFPDCSQTSVRKTDNPYFVTPNPFDDAIYIKSDLVVKASLYSLEGKFITSAQGQNVKMTVTNTIPGIYILSIQDGKSVVYYKLVKI